MRTNQEQRDAIQHLWRELDKVWDGEKRPDNWDTTCEAMAVLTESLGFEFDQSGDLTWLAEYDQLIELVLPSKERDKNA